MVGKKWIRLVKSLHQKKNRNEQQLFFVEGKKMVQELVGTPLQLVKLFVVDALFDAMEDTRAERVTSKELHAMSALKNPNGVLAVFKIPQPMEVPNNDWIVVLDAIRDPGNLGTIIRLCDWYGIKSIVCSPTTVDVYNPKVLQATMGSISRVSVTYRPLMPFLEAMDLPVHGAFMDGEPCHTRDLPSKGILVMGNEGQGISSALYSKIDRRVSIPQYGEKTAESLNVAMATGILLNEIRRKG